MTPQDDAAVIHELGGRLLTALYVALRSLKLYPVENQQVQQALDDLHGQMTAFFRHEGSFELQLVGDFFFINETRLRLNLSNFSTFGSFSSALTGHGIGELIVRANVQRSEWAPVLSLLVRDPREEDPFEGFTERLSQTPVQNIEVNREAAAQEPELLERDAMAVAKGTYAQSVRVAKDVLTDLRLGKAVNVRKVKRAVQSIVDQVLDNESSMVTMTTLRGFDEYTFTHSVNVCIFSVVIGERLGLNKRELYELGLGALFHDIGKMRVDSDVINKSGGLTDEEWEALKQHPTAGLLLLFDLHGFADVPYRQMLMAYEHHMKIDLSGYPQNTRDRRPGLFSRIVAVADGFDAGTSVRSYQYEPWPPDEVMKEMRDNPRRGFDQLVVKTFINATGVYPLGTLVILDTLELAVVSKTNPEIGHLHEPQVKIISDAMGVPLATPLPVDLAVDERAIIKTTNPQKYGIRVSDYLV